MAEFKPFNPTEFLNQQTPPPKVAAGNTSGAPGLHNNNQPPLQTNVVPPQEAHGLAPHQQPQYQPPPQYSPPVQPQTYTPPPHQQPSPMAQGFQGNPQYQGGTYNGKPNYQRTPKGQENYHFKCYLTWSPKNQKEGLSLKLTETGKRFLQQNLDLIDGIRVSEFEDAKEVVRQQGLHGKRMTGMGWFKLIQEPRPQYQNQQGGYNG